MLTNTSRIQSTRLPEARLPDRHRGLAPCARPSPAPAGQRVRRSAYRAALFGSTHGPRRSQVGRAQHTGRAAHHAGVVAAHHTSREGSGLFADSVGGRQRGPPPLNPVTACSAPYRVQSHSPARRVPGGAVHWLQRTVVQHATRDVAGGRFGGSDSCSTRARAHTPTHTRAHVNQDTRERTHPHTQDAHAHAHASTRIYMRGGGPVRVALCSTPRVLS